MVSSDIIYGSLPRRTKIICTIGPGSSSDSVITGLLQAGMDVARLNFSHGTHQDHANRIDMLRRVAGQLNLPVAILQDIPGPKDRTGITKKGGVMLKGGDDFTLTTRQVLGDRYQVSVDWPDLPKTLRLGNTIFLDDGNIKLKVETIDAADIKCKVIVGGRLGDHKGVNIPGLTREESPITDEDWRHIEFGLQREVDFIALSFIKKAEDVLRVRDFIHAKDANMPLIAKIERREALDNIDEILEVADGVMVARGDLGIEIPLEKVPIAQKRIIQKCNHLGKPVIVATQMLESMVDSARPTRAEVTDVANAIFDGTDAVMLSEETAVGHYPIEAVNMMAKVALETEAALPYDDILLNKGADLLSETDDAISYAACHIAQQIGAVAIVAFTASGSTARRVSKYRPRVPIVAITPNRVTLEQLSLSWGIRAFLVDAVTKIADLFVQGAVVARESGLARDGDLVVITGGVPIGVSGSTNLLKVEEL